MAAVIVANPAFVVDDDSMDNNFRMVDDVLVMVCKASSPYVDSKANVIVVIPMYN